MATPALLALARAWPQARLDLAVGAWSRPAVAHNPHLDRLIPSDPVGTAPLRAAGPGLARLARRLRGRYDAALVLDRSPVVALLPWLAGIPVRAGLDSGGRGFALTHRVPCPPTLPRHEADWYLDVVETLTGPLDRATLHLEFVPTTTGQAAAARLLTETLPTPSPQPPTPIALHVGGGANPGMRLPAKRWDPARWGAVLARLSAADPDVPVLLLGGPDDAAGARAVLDALPEAARSRVLDLVGRTDWDTLGALIARCRLFLGPDTGAMHLAVAVGTPVVAVFGPTDPRRYGPWDPTGRSRAVGGTDTGGDLAARAAAFATQPYHTAVGVDQVWAAITEVQALQRDA
jgi:ADP-heptose:LPS heptosyltransferase